jgi:hypothetical protein
MHARRIHLFRCVQSICACITGWHKSNGLLSRQVADVQLQIEPVWLLAPFWQHGPLQSNTPEHSQEKRCCEKMAAGIKSVRGQAKSNPPPPPPATEKLPTWPTPNSSRQDKNRNRKSCAQVSCFWVGLPDVHMQMRLCTLSLYTCPWHVYTCERVCTCVHLFV